MLETLQAGIKGVNYHLGCIVQPELVLCASGSLCHKETATQHVLLRLLGHSPFYLSKNTSAQNSMIADTASGACSAVADPAAFQAGMRIQVICKT